MIKYSRKAFTLVELLIVIGIIGLLAVTLLLTLNPAEAQKKTRDTKRIKDIQTYQSIMQQYLDDGNTAPAAWSTAIVGDGSAGTTTFAAGNGKSQSCSSNWLGVDLCRYANTIPLDPSNGSTRTCADASTASKISANSCAMFYYVRFAGADYELGARQESAGNADKLLNDGGDANRWFEIFTSKTVETSDIL